MMAKGSGSVMGHGSGFEVRVVETRSDLDDFIRLPFRLYADDPYWVAPLFLERRRFFGKKNPYFEHGCARLWTLWRGGRCVGRISAQIDSLYLARHRDETGHFGFIEGEDDPAIFRILLETAGDWLRSAGMRRMTGPFCFSINNEVGLLVDGFNYAPTILMGYAPPFYMRHIESCGFEKVKDLFCYDYDLRNYSESLYRAADRLRKQRDDITIRSLDKSRFWDDVAIILDLFNDSWSDKWGFVPMTEAEIRDFGKILRFLIPRDFVRIVFEGSEPIAMLVLFPDFGKVLRDLNGSLLPFGWVRLLRLFYGRSVSDSRLLLVGFRKRYHHSSFGISLVGLLLSDIHSLGLSHGLRKSELAWILEDNRPFNHVSRAFGARHFKTYRIYGHML